MRGVLTLIVAVILVLSPILLGQDQAKVTFTEDELNQIDAINCFGFKFFHTFCELDTADNIVISPFSMHYALGMTNNLACSDTKDSIDEVLCVSGTNVRLVNNRYFGLMEKMPALDSNVIFEIANSIWVRKGIAKEYSDLFTRKFNADVNTRDFDNPKTREEINDWVSKKTHGKIKLALEKPIPESAVMYLMNTIYLKALWSSQFSIENNLTGRFFVTNEESLQWETMSQKSRYSYFINEDLRGIEIPYGKGVFSLLVFVPPNPSDIDELAKSFIQDSLESWVSRMETDSVTLFIPKINVIYGGEIGDILANMGMSKAFNGGTACFPGALYIGQALHKTSFQMDEEGTIAAAFSSIRLDSIREPNSGAKFYVDRPFLFVIRDNYTHGILFIGKIKRPVWEE